MHTEDQVQPARLLCSKSHASRNNKTCLGVHSAHHSELACTHEVRQVLDFLFEGRVLLVLLGVPARTSILVLQKLDFNAHGSAVLEPVSALENDMLLASLLFCWRLKDECFGLLASETSVSEQVAEMRDLESVDANGRTDVAILKRAELDKHSDAV